LENIFHYKTVVLQLFSLFFISADSETAVCGRIPVLHDHLMNSADRNNPEQNSGSARQCQNF